ncbi:MAG: hypothetical protein GIX01_07295 [Candidatus Eremiobacteraeota bacterium]|nr:hypothetical protein [Candidatus Eremiobacteraeota bacterium]
MNAPRSDAPDLPRDVTEYPFIFFPVGLNLRGRKCVLIGRADDSEAIENHTALCEVGAEVRWLVDPTAVCDENVIDAFLVISTPMDAALSARLRSLADQHRFLFCAIDQPTYGFVAMQAIAKAGPVRIAISTGGIAPRVGKALRAALQRALDRSFVRFIDCHNAVRERNRFRLRSSAERRAAMLALAEGLEIDVTIRYPQWFQEELRDLRPRTEP